MVTIDVVSADNQAIIFEALGDPRNYPRFDEGELRDGDFAVVVTTQPGAIYFLRPNNNKAPERIFDGSVIMTDLLLGPLVARGEGRFRRMVEGKFNLERINGKDMDGIQVPFWLLRKK